MLIDNAVALIGNTPTYIMPFEDSMIYVKLEKFNPAGSIKDRAVLGMLKDGMEKGYLKEGDTIIEATSGNTGIAIAMLGAIMHFKVMIVMPETMSLERRSLIKAYGAELVLTPGALGMQGAMDKMQELIDSNANLKVLKQFENAANPNYHYQTTGKEIIKDIPELDCFVAGIGTGGTVSGVGHALKEYRKSVHVVGVEPAASPLITQGKAASHKIQGIGANFIPSNVQGEYIDEYMTISNEEAIQEAVLFGRSTGILVGISAGANLAAAKKLASKYKKIVTVAPDGGEKYISSGLYD